jgi:hypothetical protein
MEGHFGFLGLNVHADDVASSRVEELHGNLAQEPQAEDDDGLAQGDSGHAHGLQRDAAQRHEGGGLKIYTFGNLHAEVHWDRDHLCMARVAAAGASHPVAHSKVSHTRRHVYHHPGR